MTEGRPRNDETGDNDAAPRLIHDDRSLLFSKRYGYQPLPDVMNYKLCKEFRDNLYYALHRIYKTIPSDITRATIVRYMTEIMGERASRPYGASYDRDGKKASRGYGVSVSRDLSVILEEIIYKHSFYKVLSFCEIWMKSSRSLSKNHLRILRNVFNRGLAPYTIDDSNDPPCIVPIDTPENGAAIVGAMTTIHEDGRVNAHRSLRDAASLINDQNFNGAARSAVDAIESVAKEVAGDKSATLGSAIKTLKEMQFLKDRPRLHEGIEKLWAFASETVRHGHGTGATPEPIDRNEAVLIFCLSASLSAYLSRPNTGSGT